MRKIDQLKQLTPPQRLNCLEQQFKKNKAYFTKTTPAIGKLLTTQTMSPYHIQITDDFLTISNKNTGELCHPAVGLDRFAQTLGDWANSAWIDLIEGSLQKYTDYGPYSQFPVAFNKALEKRFYGIKVRSALRQINLPTISGGKRFSNAVVFFGLFHGLHIDYYLSRTKLTTAMFIEPDKARFVLSCYFLDYEALAKRFKGLLLHIGHDFPSQLGDAFFRKTPLTSPVWTRILPGYASDDLENFVSHFRLKWRAFRDAWLPADTQIAGIHHSIRNVLAGDRVCSGPIELSSNSRIAVVGAGPSLSDDLDRLKNIQERLVIFAAHSAVRALKKAGIRPDFQFSLDIRSYQDDEMERLNLDPDIPMVTLVNDLPEKFPNFKKILRVPQRNFCNGVDFNVEIPFLAPTTGNMALGFAYWCKPKQIYLFGLDFGFRQADQTHAAGSSYETEEQHRSVLGSGFLEVKANFSDSDTVYTQAYFNLARAAARVPILKFADSIEVINCSDGALIEGTLPKRSNQLDLAEYPEKSSDCQQIESSFIPLQENVHWQKPAVDGAEQLAAFKKAMLLQMNLKHFTWTEFADRIDHFRPNLLKRMPRKVAKNYDLRVSPYLEVAGLALDIWYQFLCFTNNEDEWNQVYEAGYEEFQKLVDKMEWQEEF